MLKTTRQKRQNLTLRCPSISVGNQSVNEVSNHKVLGVTIDSNLSWSSNVAALCKSTSIFFFFFFFFFVFFICFTSYLKSNTYMPENYSCPYSIHMWDSASQKILSKSLRALKAILLKTNRKKHTTLTCSDYNLLSILTPIERLKYNNGILMNKIMSGKVPPSLTAKFSSTNHILKSSIHQFLGLTFSHLA